MMDEIRNQVKSRHMRTFITEIQHTTNDCIQGLIDCDLAGIGRMLDGVQGGFLLRNNESGTSKYAATSVIVSGAKGTCS